MSDPQAPNKAATAASDGNRTGARQPPMNARYDDALLDLVEGAWAWQVWSRLGWQEIRRRYRRTAIGPFWTTLSLGGFIGVLGFIWAGLWGQDPKTYLPFLCAGMISWNLIQSNVHDGCTVFVVGETFIKQLRFPYSMLAWSLVWRNVILFAHHLVIFGIVALYAGVPVTATSLLVIPGVILNSLNGVWIAMVLGVVCARYRDVQQLVISLLQIAMFVTPILFAREQLAPQLEALVDYNVLFHYVELIRAPLLGRAPAPLSWNVAALSLVGGWAAMLWFYNRFRRRVPYWL